MIRRLVAIAVVAGLVTASSIWPVHAAAADDGMAMSGPSPVTIAASTTLPPTSGSLSALLATTPPASAQWAMSVTQAVRAYETAQDAYEKVKHLRLQQDATRTELTAATGALELLTRQRQELEQQVQKLEAERQERMNALRRELEARLQDELSQARQQIDQELKEELARQMGNFESRLGGLIDQNLEQQVDFQQRDIDQLSSELQTLSEELRGRLSRLQPGSDLAGTVDQSITKAIAQKQAELQARRESIKVQREQMIAKRRTEYGEKLRQQQTVEHQTRLLYKEASLRQAMAELLHGSQNQEDGALRQAKSALEDLRPRHMQATKRQALLTSRIETLNQEYAAATDRIQQAEAARSDSLAKLEQNFQKVNLAAQPEGLTWFSRVIQESPPQLASELSVLYHRITAKVEQERQLREQQKLIRERQLALQVSHEMEKRYQEEQDRRQRELQARAKKADELMMRIKELQSMGQYDAALQLLAQVQMLNPSLASQMALLQQDLETAKEQSVSQARAAQVESMFQKAMQSFEQGQYEQSVKLFEQVIAQEAAMNGTDR